MTERLPTTTTKEESPSAVDPETVAEIDSVENTLDQETIDLLNEAKERVARLLDELGPSPRETSTEELPSGDDPYKTVEPSTAETTTDRHVPSSPLIDESPLSQDEIYNTYANNIAYTAEKEKLIDSRSRLRKIGDGALRLNERLGKTGPVKWMARAGLIPPLGTRHTQKGFNFSAWAARKYVKMQEARKNREERIRAGFLSPEDKAILNAMDETTPEKIAQDEAYDTYQENLKATAKRDEKEQEAKQAQDAAFETYNSNVDATAQREHQEAKIAQDIAYDSYSDNIDTTTRREQQEAYDSYSENIDATAKRESQEAAYESYEENIEATTERERHEAHEHAVRASEDRAARRERHPVRERAADLKERAKQFGGRIGSSAMKLVRRTGSGLKAAAGAIRRR